MIDKKISVNEVARTIDKSMNYRILDIKSKKLGKITEEEKITLYKQNVPQFDAIKYLVSIKSNNVNIGSINYSKLDNKIKELENKRNFTNKLLELDLYSYYVDEFYPLKAYINSILK